MKAGLKQNHNTALVLLARNPPPPVTALALLTPLIESTIRNLWLLHVARDELVRKYCHYGTKLDMASMITAIGKAVGLNAHQAIYKHWHALSAYMHPEEHQSAGPL